MAVGLSGDPRAVSPAPTSRRHQRQHREGCGSHAPTASNAGSRVQLQVEAGQAHGLAGAGSGHRDRDGHGPSTAPPGPNAHPRTGPVQPQAQAEAPLAHPLGPAGTGLQPSVEGSNNLKRLRGASLRQVDVVQVVGEAAPGTRHHALVAVISDLKAGAQAAPGPGSRLLVQLEPEAAGTGAGAGTGTRTGNAACPSGSDPESNPPPALTQASAAPHLGREGGHWQQAVVLPKRRGRPPGRSKDRSLPVALGEGGVVEPESGTGDSRTHARGKPLGAQGSPTPGPGASLKRSRVDIQAAATPGQGDSDGDGVRGGGSGLVVAGGAGVCASLSARGLRLAPGGTCTGASGSHPIGLPSAVTLGARARELAAQRLALEAELHDVTALQDRLAQVIAQRQLRLGLVPPRDALAPTDVGASAGPPAVGSRLPVSDGGSAVQVGARAARRHRGGGS